MANTNFKKPILQSILCAINFLEHLDSSIYIFLVPIIAPIFFPTSNITNATLNSPLNNIPNSTSSSIATLTLNLHNITLQMICAYMVQVVSLLAKPLGSILFGLLVLNRSPISLISYSILGVSISALLIIAVPSYAEIGFLSSSILILLRFISMSFAAGGNAISSVLLIENKSEAQALKSNYFYQGSAMFGIIVASCLATTIIKNQEYFSSQGKLKFIDNIIINFHVNLNWKYCFLIIGILGLIVWSLIVKIFYNKKSHNNSNQYQHTTNLILIIKQLWLSRNILFPITLLFGFSQLTYVIPFVLFNILVPMITNIDLATMMQFNSILLFLDFLILLIIGKLLHNYSSQKILIISSSILSLSILPIFCLLPNANTYLITGFRIWVVLLGVVFAYPVNVWAYNLVISFNLSNTNNSTRNNNFNKADNTDGYTNIIINNKYLLIGIGNALGSSLIGKAAPSICLYLWYIFDKSVIAPALYLMVLMLATVFSIWSYRNFINNAHKMY